MLSRIRLWSGSRSFRYPGPRYKAVWNSHEHWLTQTWTCVISGSKIQDQSTRYCGAGHMELFAHCKQASSLTSCRMCVVLIAPGISYFRVLVKATFILYNSHKCYSEPNHGTEFHNVKTPLACLSSSQFSWLFYVSVLDLSDLMCIHCVFHCDWMFGVLKAQSIPFSLPRGNETNYNCPEKCMLITHRKTL